MASMDWNDLASRSIPSVRDNFDSFSSMLMEHRPAGSNATEHPAFSGEHLPTESIEKLLARHQQERIETLLRETEEETSRQVEAMVQAQNQKAWEKDREQWLRDLIGPRYFGGFSSGQHGFPLQALHSDVPTETALMASSNSLIQYRQDPETRASSFGPPRMISSKIDAQQVKDHLEIMTVTDQADEANDRFLTLAESNPPSPIQASYASAWRWMQCIISMRVSPIEHAQASLKHLSTQFKSLVIGRVRQASLAGQNIANVPVYGNAMADECSAFVELVLGNLQSVSPWATVYYCLRCGDTIAALEVVRQTPGCQEAPVMSVLTALARAQRGTAMIGDGWRSVSLTDQRAIGDLREAADHHDLHRLGVYTLLSCMGDLPTSDDSVPGFTRIEDYLFGALWIAMAKQNPVQELISLADVLKGLGPAYFGSSDSGGWGFALPMLVTQQYETALSHLADEGGQQGLLQAAHLAWTMSLASVDCVDLGKERGSQESLASSLMIAYANLLLVPPNGGPTFSVEYLARLPNKHLARKEIGKVIAQSSEMEQLVGTFDANGKRQQGSVLDRFFSADELASILGGAAEILRKDTNDRSRMGAALKCYMLAERYEDVVSLLNSMLCPLPRQDDDKKFWINETQNFINFFIQNRTNVVDVLELRGNAALIHTCSMLMELNKFFQNLESGHYQEALSIVDGLKLFPRSRSELSYKANDYTNLDPLLQQNYPSLLVGTMEALYHEHNRVKREAQNSPVVSARLTELRDQARLILTFEGYLRLPRDQVDKLARLEAQMT